MTELTQTPEAMSEDDIITYTRVKRMDLANALTKSGAPTEKEQQQVLLATLDGLDRSALGRLKIKAEEKANTRNASAAALIAEVLNQIGSSKIYQHETGVPRAIPVLSEAIPTPEIVEGELETNPAQMNFDSFTKQFEVLDQA